MENGCDCLLFKSVTISIVEFFLCSVLGVVSLGQRFVFLIQFLDTAPGERFKMLFSNLFLLVGVSTVSARSVREFLHRQSIISSVDLAIPIEQLRGMALGDADLRWICIHPCSSSNVLSIAGQVILRQSSALLPSDPLKSEA